MSGVLSPYGQIGLAALLSQHPSSMFTAQGAQPAGLAGLLGTWGHGDAQARQWGQGDPRATWGEGQPVAKVEHRVTHTPSREAPAFVPAGRQASVWRSDPFAPSGGFGGFRDRVLY